MSILQTHLAAFAGSPIHTTPDHNDLTRIADDCHHMIVAVLALMIERSERRPDDPWLDMKINLITGEDRAADDPLCGYGVINGWIQGRGIESLAGHARYLRDFGSAKEVATLLPKLDAMMRRLLDHLRRVYAANGGHLFFFMTPDGQPMVCDEQGIPQPSDYLTSESPYNATDLFASKGMYVAARYLGDDEAAAEALQYAIGVDQAIAGGAFVTDQQQLDPKNKVRPVPGRHSQGPHMVQIGGAAALLAGEQNEAAFERGMTHINHVLSHHVNINRWDDLEPWDFLEFIDDNGNPYREDGQVFSDPGHALEFVGLTLKFTAIAKQSGFDAKRIADVEATCLPILLQNFAGRFQPQLQGIVKLYDLAGKRVVNSDMPWWNLPETLRGAAYCATIAKSDADRAAALEVLAACHNAFIGGFVKRELHLQAVQTRDGNGDVVNVIPATPDADPGYHTGLSLIDAVRVLRAM